MNLLHTELLHLETFHGSQIPPYAILSHTWGDGEVLFQHIKNRGNSSHKKKSRGWNKIINACRAACQHDPPFKYIWIDTCCIDRTSSAQLSEAINSMFKWYRKAGICYAHLEGVKIMEDRQEKAYREEQLRSARWFERGWTLQELIAPADVVFYSEDWNKIGTKIELQELLSSITGIASNVLLNPELVPTQSVARRMSWAASRKTTRVEDIAYCLMGIFNVNMPLIYGEGNKAFTRLQEEIIKHSEDQSLFAWQYQADSQETDDGEGLENEGILALHPVAFKGSLDIVSHRTDTEPCRVTPRGLEIRFQIVNQTAINDNDPLFVAILSCHYETNVSGQIGVLLERFHERYYRRRQSALIFLSHEEAEIGTRTLLYIHISGKRQAPGQYSSRCHLSSLPPELGFFDGIVSALTVSTVPSEANNTRMYTPWNRTEKTVVLSAEHEEFIAALDFASQQQSGSNQEVQDGFTVVVKLSPLTSGVITLISWTEGEQRTRESLQRAVEAHRNASISSIGGFHFGRRRLLVSLKKEKLFDFDTFFLDICDSHIDHQPGPPAIAVKRIAETRMLESSVFKRLKK
jgi:hypothetical protein